MNIRLALAVGVVVAVQAEHHTSALLAPSVVTEQGNIMGWSDRGFNVYRGIP